MSSTSNRRNDARIVERGRVIEAGDITVLVGTIAKRRVVLLEVQSLGGSLAIPLDGAARLGDALRRAANLPPTFTEEGVNYAS